MKRRKSQSKRDPAVTSKIMSAIRSKENRAEVGLRKKLHALGLRYRKYSKDLPGKPDIVFRTARVAVFVDGDFWHSRVLREQGLSALKATLTMNTKQYWLAKFQRNVARDMRVTTELEDAGWL